MSHELSQIIQGQPFAVGLLLIAVYWMTRNNKDLIERLHGERAERLDKLESAIQRCEEDRAKLWERIVDHERNTQ